MILISKQQDYWDWAANVYRDEAIRFERKPAPMQPVPFTERATAGLRDCVSYSHSKPWRTCQWPEHKLAYSVISIAGLTPVPIVELAIFDDSDKPNKAALLEKVFVLPTDTEDLVTTLDAQHIDLQAPGAYFSWMNDKKAARIKALNRWAKGVRGLDFAALHAHINAPIMRIDEDKVLRIPEMRTPHIGSLACTPNPILRDYGIQTVHDDITVYQALCQWLATKQHPEAPPAAVADKYKIEQKGFDPKYGFRKAPSSHH